MSEEDKEITIMPQGIKQQLIEDEMKKSYLDYAMSVIVGRALPDVRDGLKPVHRRILFAMHGLGMRWNSPYKKCARIVGEVLGKYHPHGDLSVYDALVRMAQDFSLRYMLIDGQGNFGSVDGDSPAAMRYCVTGDTLILTNKGMMPIASISSEQEADIDIGVLSVDGVKNKATKFFDSGVHPTITITTNNDFVLEGSFNHPVMVWRVDKDLRPKLSWKLLSQIEEGDIAVINRGHSLFAQTPHNIEQYYPQKGFRNHIPLPSEMSESLAFLLGALVSEGSYHQKQILFCNADKQFYNQVKKVIQELFPGVQLYESTLADGSQQLSIYEQRVVQFLLNIGLSNKTSAYKKIPFSVLESTKEHVRSFLIALFEGDGSIQHHIDKRHGGSSMELFYSSKSKTLIHQLRMVLLNFGICANVTNIDKRNGCLRLVISNQHNIGLFQKALGFFSNRKGQILLHVNKLNKERMSKNDFIPFLNDYLRNKYSHNKFSKYNFDRYNKLEQSAKKVDDLLEEQDKELITWLLKNRYYFTPIKQVVADLKGKKVYSVKVDSTCHSFIANGFINHNTEARMNKISDELLQDIEKETIPFVENFDGSLEEPSVLPAKIPNLLVNGSSGIAVGMATNIPPHNLKEVVAAEIALIDNPDIEESELMTHLPGPDFPTGGIIAGRSGIASAYRTGRGKIRVKAVVNEEEKGNRKSLIVTELPYQVNKAMLVEQIANCVKNKQIEGISDLRDESDRKGMRIFIELKKDATPEVVLNSLYKHTRLQVTFGMILISLVNNEPKCLGLKQILEYHVSHRQVVVRKRTEYDLRKAQERAHILEGLKIALDDIDRAVALIKAAKSGPEAKEALMTTYSLTDVQSQAILDMKLQKLTGLEQEKLLSELADLQEKIAYYNKVLSDEQEILSIIKAELLELQEKYGDKRRTIITEADDDIDIEDLIEPEEMVVTVSNQGYVKRMSLDLYHSQNRGGVGVRGATTKEGDFIEHLFVANTHDYMLIFTNKGRVYWKKVYQLPEGSKQSKGRPIVNLVPVEKDEWVRAIIKTKEFSDKEYLMFVTRDGTVKKTTLEAYSRPRTNGIIAIKLNEGNDLVTVLKTGGDEQILIASSLGQAVKFHENDVRDMGRNSAGVRGIRLKGSDVVVGAIKARDNKEIFTITQNGYGKRTPISEYRLINRGGLGVRNIICSERNGPVVAVKSVDGSEDVMFASKQGTVIRTRVDQVRTIGRNTQGVKVMNLRADDQVVACARIVSEEEVEETQE